MILRTVVQIIKSQFSVPLCTRRPLKVVARPFTAVIYATVLPNSIWWPFWSTKSLMSTTLLTNAFIPDVKRVSRLCPTCELTKESLTSQDSSMEAMAPNAAWGAVANLQTPLCITAPSVTKDSSQLAVLKLIWLVTWICQHCQTQPLQGEA